MIENYPPTPAGVSHFVFPPSLSSFLLWSGSFGLAVLAAKEIRARVRIYDS